MAQGSELYKTLGMPNDEKLLNEQRMEFGSNTLTEVDRNPW